MSLAEKLITIWENQKIKSILEEFIFFFSHKGQLYGAGEPSRVMYAKMIDPKDEDNTKGWRKEASFSACNLAKHINGENNQTVFTEKDLKDIKVLTSKEDVEKKLNAISRQ